MKKEESDKNAAPFFAYKGIYNDLPTKEESKKVTICLTCKINVYK
jgi:hypothetical protein